MTTIDTGFSALPGADPVPQLAGLPSAAELSALANSLFPDLTKDFETAGLKFEPTVCAEGIDKLVKTGDPSIVNTAAAKAETAYNHLAHSQRESEPLPQAGGSAPGTADFDWAHPFGFGGAAADPWLQSVEAAADPAQNYLQDAANPQTPAVPPQTGYAPSVLSQAQAKGAGRAIDAPTSLGGDRRSAQERSKPQPTTRNDSILVGSKTLAQIRVDFPILSEKINGNPLVWLDNGATTQRPRAVIDRLTYYYEHENSNVHRGAHTLAARSTDAYENARETVARFLGAPSKDEIIFVRGTTEAINLVAHAYVKPTLEPGDEIIVSILEHHANIVPWQLIAIAHRHGVRILIDGAQSVAHIPVNVSALDADFYVFSGHKIFAPTGIGAVYGKKELLEAARPYHGGGNMIADVTFERTIYNPAPNKFEAGTGSIADAVGLGAALDYLTQIGMPSINQWEHELLQYAIHEMKRVKGLHLIGTAANKASVLSFKLDGYSDDEVGSRLNSYGIAVRTGHHCAQPVLRHFGYEGSVRPTLALYNSPDDIDALVKVLKTFA